MATPEGKSEMRRLSARFCMEVEKHAACRNRTFVGQCNHMLDVYQLLLKRYMTDDLALLTNLVPTMKIVVEDAPHKPEKKMKNEGKSSC